MARHGSAVIGFKPSQASEARETFRAQEVYGRLTQNADKRAQDYAALQAQAAEAVRNGTPRAYLPEIHPNMSPQDIAAAAQALNRFTAQPSAPSATATPSPVTPKTPAAVPSPVSSTHPSRGAFLTGQAATAPGATKPSTQTVSPPPNLGRASTVPAIGNTGSQLLNFDNTPRTLQRILPIGESNKAAFGSDFYKISPEEQRSRLKLAPTSASGGVTTDFGGNFDRKGMSSLGDEYDPRRDATKTHIAPTSGMLPATAPVRNRDAAGHVIPGGGSTTGRVTGGVVIDPKYRTPGASAIGFTTRGPAVPSQSDPDPLTGFPAGPKSLAAALNGLPNAQKKRNFLDQQAVVPSATPGSAQPSRGDLMNRRAAAPASASNPLSPDQWKLQGPGSSPTQMGAQLPVAPPYPGKDVAYSGEGGSFAPAKPIPSPAPIANIAQTGANKIVDRADVALAAAPPAPTPYTGVDKDYSGSGGSIAPFDFSHPATTIGGAVNRGGDVTSALAGLTRVPAGQPYEPAKVAVDKRKTKPIFDWLDPS